ncbi:MAG TPA: MarR family transcriptional regulator [Candidatus Angelobacter sp.]|jgi:hypothetical protein|nr:MarR family transcriptional regulator [Candidatus Angelobacter sp.]
MAWRPNGVSAQVLELLHATGPLSDRDLSRRLDKGQPHINVVCSALVRRGYLARRPGPDGVMLNVPSDEGEILASASMLMSEDTVKQRVAAHLESLGYTVTLMIGRQHGIDIDARRGSEHVVLEAKGEAALQPQQANYVIGALGELVQRLMDPDARYGLALPDNPQYRALVAKLPALARERLRFVAYFVGADGVAEYGG